MKKVRLGKEEDQVREEKEKYKGEKQQAGIHYLHNESPLHEIKLLRD